MKKSRPLELTRAELLLHHITYHHLTSLRDDFWCYLEVMVAETTATGEQIFQSHTARMLGLKLNATLGALSRKEKKRTEKEKKEKKRCTQEK